MTTVAEDVARAEQAAVLPPGDEERFGGYGVMGLPFRSGHVLAMRRFPASSVGPAYTSIWHRDPDGRWAFWQDIAAEQACPRYFGAAVAETREVVIDLSWPASDTLRLAVPELDFDWSTTVRSTPVTRVFNGVGKVLPERLWKAKPMLAVMGKVAGTALGAGKVSLAGAAPNGQAFIANPLRVWVVSDATATLGEVDFGPIGALDEQAALGEFWLPQRGILAIGRAYFRPA